MDSIKITNPEVPLVSAVMITGRQPQWQVQLAVNCFANQTYPNKELIIINNCRTQWEAAGLNLSLPKDKDGVTIATVIDTETLLSAGMCRNYAISAANGDLFVQFDANYWHSPHRIETQLETLLKYQAHICLLSRTLDYSYCSGFAGYNLNRKNAILNTMMFVRPRDVDYRDIDKGEELSLVTKMTQAGYKPITVDRPELAMRLHYCSELTKKAKNSVGVSALSKSSLRVVRNAVLAQALPGHPAGKL